MSGSDARETTILVVEDDPQMRGCLVALLHGHDYALLEAERVAEAVELVAEHSPALMILDLGLPDAEGFTLLSQVRKWSQLPIIVVSARGREQDKVRALDLGADDYLTKPFGSRELLARVRVALRRAAAPELTQARPVFELGELRIDLAQRKVSRAGQEVRLTPTEHKLLEVFAAHAGKVLTHSELLTRVWGSAHADNTQYLRVYMAHLRRKLEADPARPRLLKTEIGVGYRLELPA